MPARNEYIGMCSRVSSVVVVMCAVLIVLKATGNEGDQARDRTQAAEESRWRLQRADDAIMRAWDILGVPKPTPLRANASLVTLKEDNTPYLSGQLVGRPLWQVVVHEWSLKLRSCPPEYEDRYIRTFDVLLDPKDGRMLKIKSRWPEGVPEMAPEVDAATGITHMQRSGRERYHGFPTGDPGVPFLAALDGILESGAAPNPMSAKQIVAQYVMWSRLDQEPKAVWAIMLRGVRPIMGSGGAPRDVDDHQRVIIDAETGEWILTNNRPRPQGSGRRG